jgi:hypothetical protein
MPRGVSLSTLRTRVQRAADIEGASARFPNSELNDYINESLAELYGLIRAAYGEDYYRTVYTFTTSGNVATYNLPSNFLALISVDVPLGGNLVLTARPYMENERNLYKFFPFGAWTMNQPIWYRLTGAVDSTGGTGSPQTISFIPTPTGNYTVNCNYVPTPVLLVGDSDTFDGVAGWEEYAVIDAAMKCATKNQQWDLLQALEGRKAAVMARIEKMAPEHDGGQADRVQDVDKNGDTWWW